MTVQLQKATQYLYKRAVMAIFPLAPDQTIAQMWSSGVRGVTNVAYILMQVVSFESQLSQTERVLFLKVFFRIRRAVIGQPEAHCEMKLRQNAETA